MGHDAVQVDQVATGFRRDILHAVRRSVGTGPRRWLVAITLVLGVSGAVMVAAGRPADRTLAKLSMPVQSLMSIAVPFLGVLLVHDLKRLPRAHRVIPTLLSAMLLAAGIGMFGALVCAAALAVAPSGASQDPWQDAATIVVGSILVQVVAQLEGTALGLLVRPALLACLATIVLPMGLWLLLGRVNAIHPAQAWLAPYASTQNLLSGRMSEAAWAQWFVVLLIWGVGLNSAGIVSLRRGKPKAAYQS